MATAAVQVRVRVSAVTYGVLPSATRPNTLTVASLARLVGKFRTLHVLARTYFAHLNTPAAAHEARDELDLHEWRTLATDDLAVSAVLADALWARFRGVHTHTTSSRVPFYHLVVFLWLQYVAHEAAWRPPCDAAAVASGFALHMDELLQVLAPTLTSLDVAQGTLALEHPIVFGLLSAPASPQPPATRASLGVNELKALCLILSFERQGVSLCPSEWLAQRSPSEASKLLKAAIANPLKAAKRTEISGLIGQTLIKADEFSLRTSSTKTRDNRSSSLDGEKGSHSSASVRERSSTVADVKAHRALSRRRNERNEVALKRNASLELFTHNESDTNTIEETEDDEGVSSAGALVCADESEDEGLRLEQPEPLPNLPEVAVFNCTESVVYLLAPFAHAMLSGLVDCTVVLGAVRGSLIIEDCARVTLIAAAGNVAVTRCTDVRVHVLTNARPLLLADNAGIVFAPYHTHYPTLEPHLAIAGIALSPNRWSEPLLFHEAVNRVGSGGRRLSGRDRRRQEVARLDKALEAAFSLLSAEDLVPFAIPVQFPGPTKANPVPFDAKYKAALLFHAHEHYASHSVLHAPSGSLLMRARQKTIEEHYHSWLQRDGQVLAYAELQLLTVKQATALLRIAEHNS